MREVAHEKAEQVNKVAIPATYPYLMEKDTGIVHPYTDQLAEHTDKMMGCYNLKGSVDPKDRDKNYDPQRMNSAEVQRRLASVEPTSAGEMKAYYERKLANAREEMRSEIMAELSDNINAMMETERSRIYAQARAEFDEEVKAMRKRQVAADSARTSKAQRNTEKPGEETVTIVQESDK